jgi:hypothetical protein
MSKKKQPEILDYYPTDDDGYTLEAYISERPLLHSAVRIKYRPTPVMDRALLIDVNRQVNEKRFAKHLSDWLADHIVSWDLKSQKPDGTFEPMPIDTKAVLSIKPQLWLRLVNIVCWGSDGGDPDPDWTDEETVSDAERELQAVMNKRNKVDAVLDQLQKN